ncbi:hypothetical protein ACQ5SP_11385 [Rhodovulum sp. YNF3179]|uniref:hypothetical protein n=1 Tax=Rhodovulum sp. YNF3179 TaxID=3425127 RepID=UPI003D32640B
MDDDDRIEGYWPGYVDALSNMLLGMVFIILILAMSLSLYSVVKTRVSVEGMLADRVSETVESILQDFSVAPTGEDSPPGSDAPRAPAPDAYLSSSARQEVGELFARLQTLEAENAELRARLDAARAPAETPQERAGADDQAEMPQEAADTPEEAPIDPAEAEARPSPPGDPATATGAAAARDDARPADPAPVGADAQADGAPDMTMAGQTPDEATRPQEQVAEADAPEGPAAQDAAPADDAATVAESGAPPVVKAPEQADEGAPGTESPGETRAEDADPMRPQEQVAEADVPEAPAAQDAAPADDAATVAESGAPAAAEAPEQADEGAPETESPAEARAEEAAPDQVPPGARPADAAAGSNAEARSGQTDAARPGDGEADERATDPENAEREETDEIAAPEAAGEPSGFAPTGGGIEIEARVPEAEGEGENAVAAGDRDLVRIVIDYPAESILLDEDARATLGELLGPIFEADTPPVVEIHAYPAVSYLTMERQSAFFRAMDVRNYLLDNDIGSARISVRVHDAQSPLRKGRLVLELFPSQAAAGSGG